MPSLISGEKNNDVSVQIGATTITESVEIKLLGVTLDKNVDFGNHVNALKACTCTYFNTVFTLIFPLLLYSRLSSNPTCIS